LGRDVVVVGGRSSGAGRRIPDSGWILGRRMLREISQKGGERSKIGDAI